MRKFVTEAYPIWQAQHPGQTCPYSLMELAEFADSKDAKDPWGQHYLMWCGPHGFEVRSAGPDGLDDTRDDILSKDQ